MPKHTLFAAKAELNDSDSNEKRTKCDLVKGDLEGMTGIGKSGRSHANKESASIRTEQRYPIFSWLGNALIIIKEKRLK
jgi:hypothetical protein